MNAITVNNVPSLSVCVVINGMPPTVHAFSAVSIFFFVLGMSQFPFQVEGLSKDGNCYEFSYTFGGAAKSYLQGIWLVQTKVLDRKCRYMN